MLRVTTILDISGTMSPTLIPISKRYSVDIKVYTKVHLVEALDQYDIFTHNKHIPLKEIKRAIAKATRL